MRARRGEVPAGLFGLALEHWPYPLLLAKSVLFAIMGVSLVGWWALSRVLARLFGCPMCTSWRPSSPTARRAGTRWRCAMCVPLSRYRPRRARAAVDGSHPGEHLAVTGANGSGKTTLMLILAGREPTEGTVERPGGVGLGRPGGTAVIMQHPESQVLGTRVADDVVWGCLPARPRRRARAALRGRARRSGRTRHRQPVRWRAAAPGGGRRAGPQALAADRRRGRPAWSTSRAATG